MKKILLAAAFAATLAINPAPTYAGIYTDDLSRCLVESTSEVERNQLMQWVFSGLANHPGVQLMVDISVDERDRINQATGVLFERLLTESCRGEVQQAVRYEGDVALGDGFRALGGIAGAELANHPRVLQANEALFQYVDSRKIEELFSLEY